MMDTYAQVLLAALSGLLPAVASFAVLQWRVKELEKRRAEDRRVLDEHLTMANEGMTELKVTTAQVASWDRRFDEFRTEVREVLSGVGRRNEERWDKIQTRIDDVFRKLGEGGGA